MKLKVLTSKVHYRNWLVNAPDLPIFVQDWYLDSVCQEGFWDVLLVFDGDELIASLPFFVKKKLGFQYITMPPFVKTMGPFVCATHRTLKQEHEIFKTLLAHLPSVAGFKQQFHPTVSNWLPFYWQGFQQTTRYTYRLHELQNLDFIYDGINRNMRRNIKKAQVQVTIETNLDPILFYDINQKSFNRQQLAMPYSKAQFLSHHQALQANQSGKIFYAVDAQSAIHSVAYLIWDKKTAYYHLSGDDPALRESGAGILLIWEAIQYASTVLKLETFDFEGSMMPNVEPIRVQFGATQVPYFYVWKYFSNAYFLLDQLAVGKKIITHFPKSILLKTRLK